MSGVTASMPDSGPSQIHPLLPIITRRVASALEIRSEPQGIQSGRGANLRCNGTPTVITNCYRYPKIGLVRNPSRLRLLVLHHGSTDRHHQRNRRIDLLIWTSLRRIGAVASLWIECFCRKGK